MAIVLRCGVDGCFRAGELKNKPAMTGINRPKAQNIPK